MVEEIKPASIIKLKELIETANLIESCQAVSLITPEKRAELLKKLNDNSDKIITAAIEYFKE